MVVRFRNSELLTVEFLDCFLDDARSACRHWSGQWNDNNEDRSDVIGNLIAGRNVRININERFGKGENNIFHNNEFCQPLTKEEFEGDKYVYLSYERLLNAFSKEVKLPQIINNYDSDDCDRIIQSAVFGEVVLD